MFPLEILYIIIDNAPFEAFAGLARSCRACAIYCRKITPARATKWARRHNIRKKVVAYLLPNFVHHGYYYDIVADYHAIYDLGKLTVGVKFDAFRLCATVLVGRKPILSYYCDSKIATYFYEGYNVSKYQVFKGIEELLTEEGDPRAHLTRVYAEAHTMNNDPPRSITFSCGITVFVDSESILRSRRAPKYDRARLARKYPQMAQYLPEIIDSGNWGPVTKIKNGLRSFGVKLARFRIFQGNSGP